MTIHKSKGLQFPVVMLPNLSRDISINAKNSQLFIADNNIFGDSKLCCVYSKKLLPYIMGTDAEKYMEKENTLVLQDSVNMLYVAMTRAEKALFINADIPKDMPLNMSQLVGFFFPENIEEGSLKAEIKQEKESIKPVTINIKIEKEKELIDKKAFYSKDENITKNAAASIFGSCLHAGLFMLEYGKKETIDLAINYMNSKFGSQIDEHSFKLILKYLDTVYNNKSWQNLFKGRVFKERRIGYDNNLYSVDIYSEMEDKIIIMDYKTGNLDDKILNTYKEQVLKYAKILKKIYNKKTECYIFHIDKGVIQV